MGCANIHLPEFEERVALTPIWAAHAKNDKVIPPNLDGYLSGTDLIVNIKTDNLSCMFVLLFILNANGKV